jgi:CheY-like chemotaxis protein
MPNFNTKLLVVDDEPAMVEIIAQMLSTQGYEIRNAYDGDEAVLIAKEFRPGCVVTGVMMARMNGLQEAAAILKFLPNCKFIFVTGAAHHAAFREQYSREGWDPRFLLPKPFQRPDLLNTLALAGFPGAGKE